MGNKFEITAEFKVEIFPERVQQFIDNPTGPVSVAVRGSAERVLQASRPLIGTKFSGHHPEYGKRLKDSGTVEKASTGGPDWKVVYRHPAAVIHHNGAKPHSYGDGKVLARRSPLPVFRNPNRGRETLFTLKGVNHPGHTGNPYLVKAALQIGRASGALMRGSTLVPIFRAPTGFA